MPEANPLNLRQIRSCCACGRTKMVYRSDRGTFSARCMWCKTDARLRVLSAKIVPAPKPHPRGEDHYAWKGEEAGYFAKHGWMIKHHPKRGFCEACGVEAKTDWANVDHTYRRVREDWLELCRSCHKTRDLALGLKRVARTPVSL